MTKEWKAGDRAMVEIARMNGRNATPVGNDGYSIDVSIDVGSLRPLPPAMTEAEKALVNACIAEMSKWSTGFGGTVTRKHSIHDLTQTVLAERAPDPAEVAWENSHRGAGYKTAGPAPLWFRDALKAYDAAKGEKS